jgi:O-acetyl-ADP-ribose deacetylase (regulator of RNase III)
MIQIITGDLLQATEKYIVHQTNCYSKGSAAGIARAIFDRFPYADCYSLRTSPSEPGTLDIRGNGEDQRYVINLFGQVFPGGISYPHLTKDNAAAREDYFQQALIELTLLPNLESVAFPYHIGCGLAGGEWAAYLQMLEDFAFDIEQSQGARVTIYQRNEDLEQ